jgi:hypothetical protein
VTFHSDLANVDSQSSLFNLLDPAQEKVGNKNFNLTIIDVDTGDVTSLIGTGTLQKTSS